MFLEEEQHTLEMFSTTNASAPRMLPPASPRNPLLPPLPHFTAALALNLPYPAGAATGSAVLNPNEMAALQLYMWMSTEMATVARIQELAVKEVKTSSESSSPVTTVKEKLIGTTGISASSSFSIASLLERKEECSEASTEKKGEEKLRQAAEKAAATVYTLDALEGSDGRARGSRSIGGGAIRSRATSTESGSNGERSVCDECGKSYATSSNLSRHKQTHRPLDSPHARRCPHCDRVYVSMPALSMHLLTHNATHSCNVCGKSFSRLWLLQGHMRSHTGTRPFGCAHCGKFFADRSNLRAHILTHTGVKKFACSGCGKRFALRSYLNRHLEASCRSENALPILKEEEPSG